MQTVATKYRIYRYIKEGDASIDVEADDLLHEYGLDIEEDDDGI